MQLNCAPKYADKVVTINQIVDCYTNPKPKKTKSFQYVKMEHRPTECGATVRNEDTCVSLNTFVISSLAQVCSGAAIIELKSGEVDPSS